MCHQSCPPWCPEVSIAHWKVENVSAELYKDSFSFPAQLANAQRSSVIFVETANSLSPSFWDKSLWFEIHRFLLQCLEDLDTSLRRLNSRLFVIRYEPYLWSGKNYILEAYKLVVTMTNFQGPASRCAAFTVQGVGDHLLHIWRRPRTIWTGKFIWAETE